ncbi:MAG: L-2-hydroxyglutarate oxidase [Saprospiraceae bacterium]|nr:L-2-hydroxyglutarate oxidase [Saprospiraceae bacterium]MBK7736531.1 L-2-hydroxyglutarate oxidase [Saprospiraceae bacterium]MBK7912105.1 L-2-hydroxyglutarate oxidase [Saprospiraceae bacterium]
MKYDVLIAGAGIVGVSTAYQLLSRSPDLRIVLLEKEAEPAMHQTGHNSGVMHSGIYYKPGSYKAWNCIQGYQMLVEYCNKHDIPYNLIGKLIVANHANEIPKLNQIYNNGIQNGLQNLKLLNQDQVTEIEKNVRCLQAILIPQSGIIDYKKVVKSLALNISKNDSQIDTNKKIISVQQKNNQLIVRCSDQSEYVTDFFINCSGLQSDRIAKMCGLKLNFKIIPFKGNYFKLKQEKKDIVERLIYPVPDPQFPFLGIHYTRLMNGDQTLGPNAVLVLDREGYSNHAFDLKDSMDIINYSGFWKLIAKHWKTGISEYRRNYSKAYFAAKACEMTPGIEPQDLEPAGSGIRAQLVDDQGSMVEDFVRLRSANMIHVCNAPSPAATAGLSIGKQIADWYFEKD